MTSTAQNVVIPSKNLDMPGQLLVPTGISTVALHGDGAANTSTDTLAASTAATGARFPTLVVLHDIYGLDDATGQAAARLADLGYITLAPDLYAHSGGPQDTSSEIALVNFTLSLPDSRLIGDTLAAVQWLTQRDDVDADRIGIIGWGWGGAYALMAAAHDPRVRVIVDIGGHITYAVLTAEKPGSPLNFVANLDGVLFAAFPGNDPWLPKNEIERLAARLSEHDKTGEVKTYSDAPPRFWRDESLPQTARLWSSLQSFLRDNLADPDASDEPMGAYPNEQSRLHA